MLWHLPPLAAMLKAMLKLKGVDMKLDTIIAGYASMMQLDPEHTHELLARMVYNVDRVNNTDDQGNPLLPNVDLNAITVAFNKVRAAQAVSSCAMCARGKGRRRAD
jgi:hypothetical protein